MFNFWKKLTSPRARRPQIGEPVWWAPKGVGCTVTAVDENTFTFQGGPIVRNKKGRQVPRWTASVNYLSAEWNADTGMWIVGQGPIPKNTRGQIIRPKPVQMSGQSKGSFAVGGAG